MAVTVDTSADTTAIRPFTIEIPEADLEDLRARIAATRWPEKEGVEDGCKACSWRRCRRSRATGDRVRLAQVRGQAQLVPDFITEIDGLDIHFVHVRSKHEDALPLLVCHGWPGSVIEQMKIVDLLTDPTAHGGSASDAFTWWSRRCRATASRASRPSPAGTRPHRARLGRADEAPRLRAVRGGGRRLWRARHRVHGRRPRRPRPRSRRRRSCWDTTTNFPGVFPPDVDQASGPVARCRPISQPASDARSSSSGPNTSTRLRRAAGDAPADDVRAQRLPCRPGGLPTRPRPEELRADRSRLCRRGRGRPDPRRHPRQRHAVLADEHGSLVLEGVLGVPGLRQLRQRPERHRPGGRERLPGRASRRRGAGRRRRTPTWSTTSRSTAAGTSPPGSSRSCTPPSCARGSGRFGSHDPVRTCAMPTFAGATEWLNRARSRVPPPGWITQSA